MELVTESGAPEKFGRGCFSGIMEFGAAIR